MYKHLSVIARVITTPKWVLERQLDIERFEVRMRSILGCSAEDLQPIIDNCMRALAQYGVTWTTIHDEWFEYFIMRAARGDTLQELIGWSHLLCALD